jgi:aryl-alcohol dehydrogenase-like predicted oxidoreductase
MMEMPHRRLGRSGLAVSRLALGTMMFGGRTDEAEAGRIIAAAAEAGVNFIDTADVYAEGRSEEIIGRAIAADRPRWALANPIVTGAIVGPPPWRNGKAISARSMWL